MLISSVDNVLHFIDLCTHQQVCSKQFVCSSQVLSFSINCTDEFLFCLLSKCEPSILNVQNPFKIKITQSVDALDAISVGRFQNKQRASLVIGTDLCIVAIYNILNRAVIKVRSLPGPVVDLDPNHSDDHVGVACAKGQIFVLQLSDLDILHTFKGHSLVSSLRFHPTTPNIVGIHDHEGYLRIYNTSQPEQKIVKKVPGGIRAFDFIPNNEHVVTVGNGNKCSIFNMDTNEFVFHHHLSAEPVCVAVCNNNFALGMDNGCIHLIDIRNYLTPWRTVQCSEGRIECVHFVNRFAFQDRAHGANASGIKMERTTTTTISPNRSVIENRNDTVLFKDTDDNILHTIKKELIANVYGAISEVESRMKQQVDNLRTYVQAEFDKMEKLNDLAWMKVYKNSFDVGSESK